MAVTVTCNMFDILQVLFYGNFWQETMDFQLNVPRKLCLCYNSVTGDSHPILR